MGGHRFLSVRHSGVGFMMGLYLAKVELGEFCEGRDRCGTPILNIKAGK